jgi:hypothetical protein
MKFTKEQLEKLHSALMSAFPRHTDLARMVRFGLDENLEAIAGVAGGGTLSEVTFNLIGWAEAAGRLEELVRKASKEQSRNLDLQGFAAELGLVESVAPPVTLGFPARNKAGILVDLSHGQSEWSEDAIFSAGDGQLAQLLHPSSKELPWDIREIDDRRQLHTSELNAWSGLLLGIPYHERIEDLTRYEIVKWVRGGGQLVLLGFELGERHHETNLNGLAEEFGLRFNSDIVAPAGWQPPSKPYGEPIDFNIHSPHPVMKGVSRLRFQNLCTLTVEPGADVLLTLGDNGLGQLKREFVKYTGQGWTRGGIQKFDILANAGWVPVIAEAPLGLTGSGKVVAIGTWQLFEPGYVFPDGFDNLTFVANLFDWLGGKS